MEEGRELRQVLDRSEILDRLDNDDRLLVRVVDMYLGQAPGQLDDIRRAIASGDGTTLERAAHKLKGSVGYFGAREAVSAALVLEDIGRTPGLAGSGPALARLEVELDRLAGALVELKKGSTA